jgi:hypothetical protein
MQVFYGGGVSNNALLLNPLGGAVGIGTANPQAALDVAGDINLGVNLRFGGVTTLYRNSGVTELLSDNILRINSAAALEVTAAGTLTLSSPALNISGRIFPQNLPSTQPAAGNLELWYDPADGNRVKFAP